MSNPKIAQCCICGHSWEREMNGFHSCSKILQQKVERLEKALWDERYGWSMCTPKEMEKYLNDLYAGKYDEYLDKELAECKRQWEG